MSWDIHVQDFGTYASISEIPDDFEPKPLGPKSELIADIQQAAPQADFSDPAWGLIDTEDGSIEINIGQKDPTESFMLHVRGGQSTLEMVFGLLRQLDVRAFDMQTGEFLDEAAAGVSFKSWRDYRDQVVGDEPAPD